MVAPFSTTSEDSSRFGAIYKRVLAAYESLGYPASIVNTWAIGPHDAPDLMALIQKAKPKKILEVGTYVGVSTMLMALSCPSAHIFTVDPDLPLKIEMGATGSSVADVDSAATTHTIARAAAQQLGVAHRITFVKGGFSVRETFSSTLTSMGARAKLAGPKLCKDEGPFDFIFIDGLHTAEAVATDLQLGAKHLAPSGVMALHDCIGFWGANVRAGVMEFIRRNPAYRFVHPPFADLWRSVGVVAQSGSKAIGRAQFALPMTSEGRPGALQETFGALVTTSFGKRDMLEVSIGAPLLKDVAFPGRYISLRVLGGRGGQNVNAELDRILKQFDKLEAPVLFSADLLDFSPPDFTQDLLAAIAHRSGVLMLGVTPPGEAGIAGPESRPAAWLVDTARAHRFAAYAPPLLDLEPARYSLLPKVRELGQNSQLASSIILAPRGGFVDAKRRKLVELTPGLATEREQSELQRVHLASGYRRFFSESDAKSQMLLEQSQQLHKQIDTAQEAAQREKRWREENSESLGMQVGRLTEELTGAIARVEGLSTELAARETAVTDLKRELNETSQENVRSKSLLDSLVAESSARDTSLNELSTQLTIALEAGQREKAWREEAAASYLSQVANLTEQSRGAIAREAILRAQNETVVELARLESELYDQKEARLRKIINDLAAFDRERDAERAIIETGFQDRLGAAEGDRLRLAIERDVLRQELDAQIEQFSAEREAKSRQAATIDGLRDELAHERALRAEIEARAQDSDATGTDLSARLDATANAKKVEDASAREEHMQSGERLNQNHAISDEYLMRLVDVYSAMDSFDSLVSVADLLLASFERDVIGMPSAAAEAEMEQADVGGSLDASSTIAEIERLKGRWRNIFSRLGQSIEAGTARVQQLNQSQVFLGAQLVALQGSLETRTSEGQGVSARLAALSVQNADLIQRLIDVYQACDDIDAAVIEQLRMCSETDVELLGLSGPTEQVGQPDDTQDHLVLLRQRSRALSEKISRLLLVNQSRFDSADETFRNCQSNTMAPEAQISGIRSSTSRRASGAVRAAGKPVRAFRRRVRAGMRGRELLKLKGKLDGLLKPQGLQCPVFDAGGYARRYGDVPAHRALRHYLSFGEREGRMPLQTFDPAFYYRMYPDVQAARASALLHFLKHGVHEGRSPCPALHPLGGLAADKGISPLEYFAQS